MNNNSDPMFEQYAEMDFADAAPVAKVPDLAKLQAAHSGKSRIQVIRGLRVIIDVDVAQRLAELEMKTESLELSHDTFSRNTRLQLRQLLEAVRPSRATPQAHRLHHAG